MATNLDQVQIPEVTEKFLYVLDTTAHPPYPDRTHEILLDIHSGVVAQYTFHWNEYLKMPADHAMRLISIPEFVIKKDPNGEGARLRPLPKRNPGQAPMLQDDQCVAHYDELTQGALFTRVKSMPGSEDFTSSTTKKKLIDFLIGRRATADTNETPEEEAADEEVADLIDDEDVEMDEDEIEDFMPKPDLPGAD